MSSRARTGHLGSADAQPDEGLGGVHGGAVKELQHEVEQFLYRQSELLDTKQWQDWIDLFTPTTASTGCRPSPRTRPGTAQPAIFAEDKNLMTVRMKRVLHPDAWSQRPLWETNHVVSNVIVEKANDQATSWCARRFHMMELRRDDVRHFAGAYRHHLKKTQERLPHQAAARRHDQRAGGLRLRAAGVGLARRRVFPLAPPPVAAPVVAGAAGLRPLAAGDHPALRRGARLGELYEHAWASLGRSLPGFVIGTSSASLLGLAAGMARWFDRLLQPGGVPHLPGAEDRDAADLHALVRHRRPLQDADHRAGLLLPGVHQRLLRRARDARDPGVVGAQHGRRARRDLPPRGAAERRAA